MSNFDFIEKIDEQWDDDGFFGQIRSGLFSQTKAKELLELLSSIQIDDDALVPKRAISILWYIPSFLAWQRERIAKNGGDVNAYDSIVTQVHNILENVLGVP